MIEIKNLTLNYRQNRILDIKNLSIDTSKITALMGSNGSGKSTLMRVISFLQRPSGGIVSLWGEPYPSLKTLRQISLLLPEPVLLKRSVEENFKFALKSRNLISDFKARIGESLELVGLNESFLKKRHFELSSGQTQRIAFALNLVLRSKLYLLDEPTNSVDLATAKLFSKAILYLKEQYKSGFIIASHDEKWLSAISQNLIFLHKGQVGEFEYKNIFDVKNGVLNFGNDNFIILPNELKSGVKVAINPSKIRLSKEPKSDYLIGIIHSVSLYFEDKILVKIKIGDFLIKAILKGSDKFITGEMINFSFDNDAFCILE